MKNVVIFLVFFLPLKLLAFPFKVSGKIVDGLTKKPISGARVFVNKSSRFSFSDSSGGYLIAGIADTAVELVVYVPGYETLVYRAYGTKPVLYLRFEMQPLASTPEQKPDSVNGGQEQVFLSNFFGPSNNAYETYLLNRDVLRYNYNIATGKLSVVATDMLRIINDGLGYTINYQLESFSVNLTTGLTDIRGYYFFKELTTKKPAITEKWQQRRRSAYKGSLLHFMKAVYANRVSEEGFMVSSMRRVLEGELDYRQASKSKKIIKAGFVPVGNSQKKFVDIVDKIRQTNEFRRVGDSSAILFAFPGSLMVVFKSGRVPAIDEIESGSSSDQVSLLHLGAAGVKVYSNGFYFEEEDLYIEGSMSEKMGNKLPEDYFP